MDAEQLNRLARQFRTVDEIGFHGFSLYLLKNRISSTSMLDYPDEFPVNWGSFRQRVGRVRRMDETPTRTLSHSSCVDA
jgi:hypothetical protein